MQFEFNWKSTPQCPPQASVAVGQQRIILAFVRNARARRYVLRLQPDGSARVTIPRRGSLAEARRFAERNVAWIERTLQRLSSLPRHPQEWLVGTDVLFQGEMLRIEAVAEQSGQVRIGNEIVAVSDDKSNLRERIENHFWNLAQAEFPPRVFELAAAYGLIVNRVTVRNQRSRWGSCSRRGTVSLNWRLIQTPPFVRDYVILHELMHLREMNHSRRFWREVERVCPDYELAERWLKAHRDLLR